MLPHLPGLAGGFVYDDFRFVKENPGVHRLSAPHEFFLPERMAHPADRDIWRPIRTAGFALQHALFGEWAAGYHLFSLLLAVGLVRGFLAMVANLSGNAPKILWSAGLLFGSHPLLVESVAWISSQGDLWAALFVCLALVAWCRERRWFWLAAPLAWLSKESAIPLLGMVILADLIQGKAPRRWRSWAVLAASTVLFLVLRQQALGRGFGLDASGFGQQDVDFAMRFLEAHRNLVVSLRLFVFPWPLLVDPTRATVPSPSFLWALFLWVLLGGLGWWAIRQRRARPGFAFGIGFALLAFVPTSGLLTAMKSPYADRFLLLPCAGLVLAATSWFDRCSVRGTLLVVLLGVSLLGTRTVQRTLEWRSQRTLFEAELRHHPSSIQAHLGIGSQAMESNDWERARVHLSQVVSLTDQEDPRRLAALHNLCTLEYEAGSADQARHWGNQCRALVLSRTESQVSGASLHKVWIVLGNLERKQNPAAAIQILEEGMRRFGRRPGLLESLAICFDMTGRAEAAEKLHREVLELAEPTATRYYHLALSVLHQNRAEDARELLQQAVALDSSHQRSRALLKDLETPQRPR